jgi:hypothetical protein
MSDSKIVINEELFLLQDAESGSVQVPGGVPEDVHNPDNHPGDSLHPNDSTKHKCHIPP